MPIKILSQEFYDNLAPNYDATLKDPKIDAQHVNEAAKIFQQHNNATSGSILDLGCGTGLLKDLLGDEFDYTGIDISEEMLKRASDRGYQTIHKPVEDALSEIPDRSYDFVFVLGTLLFVEDIDSILKDIERIARQSILLSLDEVTEEYKRNFSLEVYNHFQVEFPNTKEDYFIRGWTSPTTGITIKTRMIYMEKK